MAVVRTLFVSLLAISQAFAVSDFPTMIRVCRQTHLDRLNECVADGIMRLRPLLAKGIPELNVPQMDPHAMAPINFVQSEGGVRVRAVYDQLVVNGISGFDLKYFDWHFPNQKLYLGLVFPTLLIKGRYNISGNIFSLPIEGDGAYSALLKGVAVESESNLGIKGDVMYLKDFRLDFTIQDSQAKMDNLFSGNTVLSETMHHFLKENNALIMQEIKPELRKQFSNLLGSIIKALVNSLPPDVVSSRDLNKSNSNDRHRKKTIERLAARNQG